jgi:hypothetical protein
VHIPFPLPDPAPQQHRAPLTSQQDRTPNQTYERVFYLLIAIKSIEVLWGPVYDYLDGRWLGHSLRRPELERLRIRKEAAATPDDLPGWRVSKVVRGVVGLQLCAMIVASWAVSGLTVRAGVMGLGMQADESGLYCVLAWDVIDAAKLPLVSSGGGAV